MDGRIQLGVVGLTIGLAMAVVDAQPAAPPATAPAIDYTAVYPRSRDIRAFARARPAEGGVPYSIAKREYSAADLSELHAMVLDPKEAPDARMRAATIIGYLGSGKSSVNVLVESVTRPEDFAAPTSPNIPASARVTAKVRALEWAGLAGKDDASAILRKAITPQGAAELAAQWIDSPALPNVNGGKDAILDAIRGRAAIGLVYSQVPENLELVEETYQRSEAERPAFTNLLSEAMARRDMIADMGMEKYLADTMAGGRGRGAIATYLQKYSRGGRGRGQ